MIMLMRFLAILFNIKPSFGGPHYCFNAYRLNSAMYQICHCEAVGRGNLQHRGMMTDAPINIEILDLQC